ncbi:hypothetical protein BDY24DRAFT_441096 [Mrakia frigida]|uniref:uncharacterized protein n=1 Tax=Mrakia frigida TaxID=29902 RepID=UPI003FCC0014
MVAILTLFSLALVALIPSVQAIDPSAPICTTSYTCPYAEGRSTRTTINAQTTLLINGATFSAGAGRTTCRIYVTGTISGTATASNLIATYSTGSLVGTSAGTFQPPSDGPRAGQPLVTAPPTEPSSTGPAGCRLARRTMHALDYRQAVRPTVTGGKVVARPKQTQVNGAREDQKEFWKKSRAANARIR